jgi:hypothetical protein
MDDLEEVIWLYRMNSSIEKKKRVHQFSNIMDKKPVPVENCRPYMDAWLQCVDTKDSCCGSNKCKYFFVEWQNCHVYNDKVNRHNNAISGTGRGTGTYNGLSTR